MHNLTIRHSLNTDQERALRAAIEVGDWQVTTHGQTAKALERRGYVEVRPAFYGGVVIRATEAGRALIHDKEGTEQ